jgi:D-tyrosyl-tRNA(Tyr) deacylase
LKALLQRVQKASVSIDGVIVSSIGYGIAAFIGVAQSDTEKDVFYLVDKVCNLRIFTDNAGKFNLSALDTCGQILAVSQFTLLAYTRKGRRPSFTEAAPPDKAEALFDLFVEYTREAGLQVETGRFQKHMLVEIYNDGPVTILLDSKDKLP